MNKLKFLCEILQELRKYLLANHMKHLIQKGDRNAEELGKREIIDIIQSTSELIKIKHGLSVDARKQKSFSECVHEIFPQLSTEVIIVKLAQRIRNMRRTGNQKKCKKTDEYSLVKDHGNAIDFENCLEGNHIETNEKIKFIPKKQ